MNFGFMLPEQAEELTVPAQKRLWLDKKECLFPNSEPSEQEPPEETGPSSDRPVA